MDNNLRNVFRTYVQGKSFYTGDSLETAIRVWDSETYNLGKSVAGGVTVQQFSGDVMVRDGWVMHVMEDGTVFLNPSLSI